MSEFFSVAHASQLETSPMGSALQCSRNAMKGNVIDLRTVIGNKGAWGIQGFLHRDGIDTEHRYKTFTLTWPNGDVTTGTIGAWGVPTGGGNPPYVTVAFDAMWGTVAALPQDIGTTLIHNATLSATVVSDTEYDTVEGEGPTNTPYPGSVVVSDPPDDAANLGLAKTLAYSIDIAAVAWNAPMKNYIYREYLPTSTSFDQAIDVTAAGDTDWPAPYDGTVVFSGDLGAGGLGTSSGWSLLYLSGVAGGAVFVAWRSQFRTNYRATCFFALNSPQNVSGGQIASNDWHVLGPSFFVVPGVVYDVPFPTAMTITHLKEQVIAVFDQTPAAWAAANGLTLI